MVSQALVQAKMNYGLGKSAAALGAACPWYRPSGPNNPLASGNQRGTLKAGFQIPGARYEAPSRYGKPEWWGLFDATQVRAGDYLIEPALGTFFVASVEPIHYPLCISCNQTLTLSRPAGPSPVIALQSSVPPPHPYYGGDTTADEAPLMAGWPAAVLQGTKGEKGETSLPGDMRLPWALILLPAVAGVELLAGDQAVTNEVIPRRYTLSSCELTSLGWRLSAALANP